MTMLQLSPPIPITTPKGPGIAHFLIDPGVENHLQWVVVQNSGEASGQCWTWQNPEVRFESNVTLGRETPAAEPQWKPYQRPTEANFSSVTITSDLAKELKRLLQHIVPPGTAIPQLYQFMLRVDQISKL